MPYTVILPKLVQKQIERLPAQVQKRLLRELLALQENPRPVGTIKLKGYESEYRIRIGDYRVRYEIRDEETVVVILHCGHRKDIYQD